MGGARKRFSKKETAREVSVTANEGVVCGWGEEYLQHKRFNLLSYVKYKEDTISLLEQPEETRWEGGDLN